jgi:hypothetical protein
VFYLEILCDKIYKNIFYEKTSAKIRILICDDDTLIIGQVQEFIKSYFEASHLKCPSSASFTSGEALLADVELLKCNIFIDTYKMCC